MSFSTSRRRFGAGALAFVILFAGGCQEEQPLEMPSSMAPAMQQPDHTISSATSSSIITKVWVPVNLTAPPDGRWMACRQKQGEEKPSSLLLFDARTGMRRDIQPLAQGVDGELHWSGTKRLVASGTQAQVWKVSSEGKIAPVATFGHPKYLRPDSAAAHSAEPWKEKPTYLVQFTTVTAVHQLGARVIARNEHQGDGNSRQFIEIFNPKSGKPVRNLAPPGFAPANANLLSFSPTGESRILVAEYPREFLLRFSLWEPRFGRRLWQQTLPGPNPHIEFTLDAQFLLATQVTGSRGGDLFPFHDTLVFDARTGKKVRALPTQSTVYAAAIAGDTLVTYGSQNRPERKQNWTSLQFTNWRTGRKTLHCWMPAGTGQVQSIAASSSGAAVFASRSGSNELVMWRTADLKRGVGTFKTLQAEDEENDSEASE